MRICPECGRNYSNDAVVCAFDGMPLSTGTTRGWEQGKASDPEPGDVIGVYRVVEKIGQGGMGMIFKAEHVRLGRQVALKVLKSKLVERLDVVARFFKEARAVNDIRHPHIIEVHDFVEIADEDPPLVYMVMDLLEGQNLGARIRRGGPLGAADVVTIGLQVTDALRAVHEKGILHRDLKPENVFLLATDDGAIRVKLLDFGIARAFGKHRPDGDTKPGSAVGTPEYMSPEQILEKELDPRTDVYALGLLFYEMLTGRAPFKGESYGEVMIRQVKAAPAPIASLRADPVPEALDRLVMRCLEKDRDRRFRNMIEVREALLEMGHDTLESAPIGAVSRPRQGRVIGLAAILLLLGAAAVAWALLSGGEEPPAAPPVAAPDPAPDPDMTVMAAPAADAATAPIATSDSEPKQGQRPVVRHARSRKRRAETSPVANAGAELSERKSARRSKEAPKKRAQPSAPSKKPERRAQPSAPSKKPERRAQPSAPSKKKKVPQKRNSTLDPFALPR
jgi:serine/threonine-protein kinase